MMLVDIGKEVAQRVELAQAHVAGGNFALAAHAFEELAKDLDAWPGAVASGLAATPKKDPIDAA